MVEFPHLMMQEIYEQPEAMARTVALYVENGRLRSDAFAPLANWLNERGEVLIAASGTSRHAGLAGEVMLEDLCGLSVDVEYSSEFITRAAANARRPSVIVISQSGETSDTLAALRRARASGEPTLSIANVFGSTMQREADSTMPLGAGPERAIQATKSFTCQLTALVLLALYEAERLKTLDEAEHARLVAELAELPERITPQLDGWRERMAELARKYSGATTFLYLARGVHYAIAREGALKMKETSYVEAEGYPTGELKHGPNALVSEQVPLVVLATVDREVEGSVDRYERTVQLLRDLKVQGARVLAIANRGDHEVAELVSDCVYVEPTSEHLLPLAEIIPLQMFAYFIALELGVDVDRPRNLKKAVIEA